MRKVLFLSAFFLVACGSSKLETHDIKLLSGFGEDVIVSVEIADDAEERAEGLMHREELEGGMLFVFEEEARRSFWMKNTLIPLEIIFFDAEGNLVSTTTMEPCEADPCRQYTSSGPAQYALEVPVGFIENYQVSGSWKLQTNSL